MMQDTNEDVLVNVMAVKEPSPTLVADEYCLVHYADLNSDYISSTNCSTTPNSHHIALPTLAKPILVGAVNHTDETQLKI